MQKFRNMLLIYYLLLIHWVNTKYFLSDSWPFITDRYHKYYICWSVDLFVTPDIELPKAPCVRPWILTNLFKWFLSFQTIETWKYPNCYEIWKCIDYWDLRWSVLTAWKIKSVLLFVGWPVVTSGGKVRNEARFRRTGAHCTATIA